MSVVVLGVLVHDVFIVVHELAANEHLELVACDLPDHIDLPGRGSPMKTVPRLAKRRPDSLFAVIFV